jgi:pyrimidine-nucleoside phosphorylase
MVAGEALPFFRCKRLAKMLLIQTVGRLSGRRCLALLTDMSQPLGRAVGNALEVAEVIQLLQIGKTESEKHLLDAAGHSSNDLLEVTFALGAEMLQMSGAARDAASGRLLLREKLLSGAGFAKFAEMARSCWFRFCFVPTFSFR